MKRELKELAFNIWSFFLQVNKVYQIFLIKKKKIHVSKYTFTFGDEMCDGLSLE